MFTSIKEHSSTSIRNSMMMMMTGLIIVTICALALSLVFVGVLPSLNDAAFRYLHNQSLAQGSRITSQLTGATSGVWRLSENLSGSIEDTLKQEQIDYSQLKDNQAITEEILSDTYDVLAALIAEQSVSGAFIILEDGYEVGGKSALYLRNAGSLSSRNSPSSLTLLRGPSGIAAERGIALDKCWSYGHFMESEEASLFYVKPLQAARIYVKAAARDLAYASSRFRYEPADIEITTYSVPIIGKHGEIYGVCGIEFSLTSLSRMAPTGALPFDDGYYIYGQVINDQIIVDSVIANDSRGTALIQSISENITLKWESEGYGIYKFKDENGQKMLAAVISLELYERNSPFLEEQYQFLVIAPRSQVLADSIQIVENILALLVLSAILSFAGASLLSRFYTKRIENLATQVKEMNHERPALLPRTMIREVDLLSEALEKMNEDINNHAARMSTIVESVGMPMGAFELNLETDRVFLTDTLFKLLEIPHEEEDSQYISGKEFRKILPEIDTHGDTERIDFCWESKDNDGEVCWLRLNRMVSSVYIYGTVLDITEEMLQKARLEYEKNYDSLTRLMNRNAYPEAMANKIKEAPDKMGVLLFADLDNLKNINDTYGHGIGDLYILAGAEGLKEFGYEEGVVARVAGDEFAVYLHGADNREELRVVVDRILERLRNTDINLPNGGVRRICVSAGLAYYPDDGKTIEDLIRYADFAMYEIKRASKNGTKEFSMDRYIKNSPNI